MIHKPKFADALFAMFIVYVVAISVAVSVHHPTALHSNAQPRTAILPLILAAAAAYRNRGTIKRGISRLWNNFEFPEPNTLNRSATSEYDYGQGLTNSALGDMGAQEDYYKDQVNAGGLPDDLRQQFSVMRGGLQDDAVRSQRAFLAKMNQRLLANPTFRPEAASEYDLENQQQSDEQLFKNTNDLNFGESSMALENTNKLLDRIDSIGKTRADIGQNEEDRARRAQIAAMLAKLDRRKAVASTFTSILGKFGGGGLGG